MQAAAGIRLLVDLGDEVTAGQPLLELHTDTPDAVAAARAALGRRRGERQPHPARPPLIGATRRP